MKILHLMKPEKFTKGVSSFYDSYFNNGEHEICYINSAGSDSLINEALSIKQTEVFLGSKNKKNTGAFVKGLCEYDYVVLHSLFFANYNLLFHPRVIKKIIWIAWGYDLYNWSPMRKGIKAKLSYFVEKYIRNHCGAFVGIFPPDCEFFKEKFPKSKAKIFYAPYCEANIPEEYLHYSGTSNLDKRIENNQPIYIQIGHSATRSLNHKEAIDSLSHLKDKNVRIFLPLSYGNAQYGDDVQRYAETIFGEKVICLRDFMPRDQYFALLDRIDIAVFNTQRQIGLGNINTMIFRNVKLYMPEDSVMYRYFVKKGVPIQRFEDLQNQQYEELKTPVKTTDPETFNAFIKSYQDMDANVALWKTVYDSMKAKVEGKQ